MRPVEHEVAAVYDEVGFDSAKILEHRLERGKIAVYVRNDRQPHSYLIASNRVPHLRQRY
jgi:hypothetical protein